ncbi:hypothetical protein OIV83_006309 [Microbotryomycetes sp. JL201]|nr:hypothetical protein OIV83_006309 [Microbotryomycetes sp. JL201]
MNEHVDALARGLLKQGVEKGDRIGAVLVCINPASSVPELRAALNLTGCRALVISPTIKNRDLVEMLLEMLPTLSHTPVDKELIDEECPMLNEVFIVDNTNLGAEKFRQMLEKKNLGGRDFRNLLDWEGKGIPAEAIKDQHPDDVINHQFTSGTTAFPKAVALTHRNILNNGRYIGQCMKLKEPTRDGERGEALVNVPPNFHCFGLVLGNLAFWTHAGCIIFGSESFDPALALRAAHIERATAIHGVPTMFIAELNLLDKLAKTEHVQNLTDLGPLDFTSLRTGIAAGSPVPDDIMRRLINRLNLKDLTITYGLTECSPALVMSTTQDPIDKKCETIGRVMPHAFVKIVSPDDEHYPDPNLTKPVKVGEKGELWGGGYAVMKGYWNNEHETAKATFTDKNGVKWMKTGDQATMDEQGYIRITGRIKDLIIRGGENLSGVLIEARALLCPGVNDCSVVAVSDSFMGEVPGAFVSRAATPEGRALTGQQLRQHVAGLLGHQHAPDWVWFLGEDGVNDAFPVTQSGKIRKVELREWTKELVAKGVGKVRTEK